MMLTPTSEHPGIASLGHRLERLPVLVAMTHDADATGAMSVAESITQRYGSVVNVLHVAETADEIVRYARAHRVALILTGRESRIIEEPTGREITLALARCAQVPVMAVTPDLHGLPRRAVAGIDFTPTSLRAARAALALIARPASPRAALLRLLHVGEATTRDGSVPVDTFLAADADRGRGNAFDVLIKELDAPEYVRVEGVVRYGSVSRELVRLADDSEADLIVIGTRHPTRVGYGGGASVTDSVLRDARCSVLAVPPPY
jgi:nucleotide-binding universal stress UspA family protein